MTPKQPDTPAAASASGCGNPECLCTTPLDADDLHAIIDHHGWAVFTVADGFAHTIGLTTEGLPELVVHDLQPASVGPLLHVLAAAELARRELFQVGTRVTVQVGDDPVTVLLRPAPETLFAHAAVALYGEGRVRLLEARRV